MKLTLSPTLLAFLFSIGLFLACSTEEVEPEQIELGTDYFPVEIGKYWTYRVDTLEYTFAGNIERGFYFLKEKISDSLYRQEGNMVYRIERFKTLDTNQSWILDSVWSMRVDKEKILKTENNRPLVRLRFPLREGLSWDINQFNPLQDSNSINWAVVKEYGKPFTFKGQLYPSATILEKRDSNCVNNSAFLETYLKGIGLAFKQKKLITYDLTVDSACSKPIRKIESGYDQKYTLLQTGKE
jgi:hypothetical protein